MSLRPWGRPDPMRAERALSSRSCLGFVGGTYLHTPATAGEAQASRTTVAIASKARIGGQDSRVAILRAMLPYDEAGAGPTVVLLHAGIADRSMWAEHLGPFAE